MSDYAGEVDVRRLAMWEVRELRLRNAIVSLTGPRNGMLPFRFCELSLVRGIL